MATERKSRRRYGTGGTNGDQDEPCYVISVAARMVGLHAQTLRYYERVGVVGPSRSQGNIRLYSQREVEQLRKIKTLMDDLGINLAGVEVILRMMKRMEVMEGEMRGLLEEVEGLRAQLQGNVGGLGPVASAP